MLMGNRVTEQRVLPAVIRPDLDAMLAAPSDKPSESSASAATVHNALATFLSTGAHLVRIAF